MPKRGGNGPRFSFNNDNRYASMPDYYDHDNHDRSKDRNTRRVSFKPSQPQRHSGPFGKTTERMAEMAIRTLEDDEDMGISTSAKYFDRANLPRRKGSPIPKGRFSNLRKLMQSTFGWYQVLVQGGQRYTRDDVVSALHRAIAPHQFHEYYWHTEKNCVIFFVDDHQMAEQLQKLGRSVQMHDGQRLFVRVRGGCPNAPITEEYKLRMKQVMAKRYNNQTRALDLTKFYADPDFKEMFCSLVRTPILAAAVDIIEKNIPEIEALNLSSNYINSMEGFKNAALRLKNLKILYLNDNKITSLAHLLVLRNVPLVELVLKGNPLVSRYKDHALYISEVRRKFPKILKLDGETLEPQVLFDINDSHPLPAARASFLCDANGAEIIRQFLDQYFSIIDSSDRQPLLNAYHEQALLSVSVPPASQAGRIHTFWKYNRNFLRVVNNDDTTRFRPLRVGRLNVVSMICEWPRMLHDRSSFTVDLTIYTPNLIAFTVSGMFKEFETSDLDSKSYVRYFQRQLIVVPTGSGYCIRNELVLITSATAAQARSFNDNQMPSTSAAAVAAGGDLQSRLNRPSTSAAAAASSANVVHVATTIPGANATSGPGIDEATKIQMLQALCAQTNMNLEWGKKCLDETNWDFNRATFVFNELNKEGKIPVEAFAK